MLIGNTNRNYTKKISLPNSTS